MITRSIAKLALILSMSGAAPCSWALDIPENGDAVHYQLGASSDAVIARLIRRNNDRYSFELIDTLRGNVPRTFVLEEDGYLQQHGLRPGQSYLLYLRKVGPTIALATSIHSIQAVSTNEVPAYKEAIGSYVANLERRDALKPVLKKQVESNVRYLQYSAVADLKELRLLDKNDVADLAKLLESRRIVDPRAKVLVIDGIATTNSRDLAPLLESLATNKSEPTPARGAAITALHQLDATESLRKIGPSITSERSPALIRRLLPEDAEKLRQ